MRGDIDAAADAEISCQSSYTDQVQYGTHVSARTVYTVHITKHSNLVREKRKC